MESFSACLRYSFRDSIWGLGSDRSSELVSCSAIFNLLISILFVIVRFRVLGYIIQCLWWMGMRRVVQSGFRLDCLELLVKATFHGTIQLAGDPILKIYFYFNHCILHPPVPNRFQNREHSQSYLNYWKKLRAPRFCSQLGQSDGTSAGRPYCWWTMHLTCNDFKNKLKIPLGK